MEETGKIKSSVTGKRIFNPPSELSNKAYITNMDEYNKMYQWSISDPEDFWAKMAEQLEWQKKWDKVLVDDFKEGRASWFVGGQINAGANCLDRHLKSWRKNKVAIIWEGDIGDSKTLSYQQLHREVCKFANVLRKHNVKKGDRIALYLPMILELPIAMLACARIGAIHCVIYGGLSAQALKDRILDCGATMLICSDGYYRGGRIIRSKDNVDVALEECPAVNDVIIVQRANIGVPMKKGRDCWWHDEVGASDVKPECEPAVMNAEDPLFIMYTSGSTGKPKGIVHTQAGYLLYVYQTFKWVFDVKDDDTFWCTADIGWITGHSYTVYGPLAFGATSVMFEGIPTYPHQDRFWDIIEKYQINIFYSAPALLRFLMRAGNRWPDKHDLSSLRLLGLVGETVDPEVWMWYYNTIGKGQCPIVDTYWQTETGGIVLSPLPGATPLKPGSVTLPFPGIQPAVLRSDGSEASVNEGGYLVMKRPWPGLMQGVYGDPKRFKNTYFAHFSGNYTTGDDARVDNDGYYWLMGRIDDVIMVSGYRISTIDIETALVSNEKVAEAAVVGVPDKVKGQAIYAFVTLKEGVALSDDLKMELTNHVRDQIGPIAAPDEIQFADGLPKTRSGKIMRRILNKIAAGDIENLGDTTTLANPSVVESLASDRVKVGGGKDG
jgi:acetyl-CoA synthetase